MEEVGWTKRWRKRWECNMHRSAYGRELIAFRDWIIDAAAWESGKSWKEYVGMVEFERGELVTTTIELAQEFAVNRQRVRTWLKILKDMEFLTIKTTNRISRITIINYNTYQDIDQQNGQQTNQQLTSNQPAANQHLNKEEVKKLRTKEEKKPPISPTGDAPTSSLPGWIPVELWASFVEYRKKIKKPMTAKAQELNIKKLSVMRDQGHNPIQILETTIENGWLSFYQPKPNYQKSQPLPKFNDPKEDSKKWMPTDS